MVEHVANDFENEYMQPDDPSRHGRVFTVTEADACLVLRLNRDESGGRGTGCLSALCGSVQLPINRSQSGRRACGSGTRVEE